MKKMFAAVILSISSLFGTPLNAQLNTQIDMQLEKDLERPLLYAPWRDNYDKTVNDTGKYHNDRSSDHCPFCVQCTAGDDVTYFVLYRGRYNFIMMNAYPYSRGHLLVLPYLHSGDLSEHCAESRAEMMELANASAQILKKRYNYTGFNIGFNIGAIAGASIPGHLHMQIIPREKKSAAFIELIGKASVVNFKMQNVYQELLPLFCALG